MLKASILLAIAKDIGGFPPIAISEVIFFTYSSFHYPIRLKAISGTHVPPLVWNIDL